MLETIKSIGFNDFNCELDILKNNKFFKICAIKHARFKACDLEIDGGYFIADTFLTHNSKIGVMFGDPRITSGGNALKFYASIRLDVASVEKIKAEKEKSVKDNIIKVESTPAEKYDKDAVIVGNRIRIKVIKNKVAPPFKSCEAVIMFESGMDTAINLFPCLLENGKIKKSGNTYTLDGKSLGVGKKAAMEAFGSVGNLGDLYDEYVQSKVYSVEEEAADTVEPDVTDDERAEIETIRKRKELKKKAKLKNA
jgi:hypothetical protein